MDRTIVVFAPSEWNVMEAVWAEPKTLMELVRELNDSAGWAKSTVTPMARRMKEKGLLTYELRGREKLFRAAVSWEDVVARETSSLLSHAYNESVSLMLNAMAQRQQLSKTEIHELYAILQKAEEAGS